MNRHGEGRPSKARWYQRTAAISRRAPPIGSAGAFTSAAAAPPFATVAARDRRPALRTTVRRRRALPRSDTNPQAVESVVASTATSAGGAGDCAPLRGRRRGRSHMPPAVARREGRVRTCTTGLRCEHASRSERCAQRTIGRGRDRSSRQTVAALGPTSLQHGAPTTGAHPGAEAVLLGALQIVRLKGALQRSPPRQAARRLRVQQESLERTARRQAAVATTT